ncbi:hypothetical protein PCANC_18101 [Puccinia coronata f. sp. avenae]|jgi:hypothetical protein|uniref:Uncharacterized protein n=1 Tax=Puccinia coronata f. sp. avenae TaxID=200324 RepID=A0A2N5SL84_9BASI|nr:hypothetical protein PCANC_18101 [Puccinia coronata f. sp. avenae]
MSGAGQQELISNPQQQSKQQQRSILMNSLNGINQEMANEIAHELEFSKSHNHRWSSSGSTSSTGSSSTITFFEMVNAPSQLVTGSDSKGTRRFKSTMVVVIEDDHSTAFELLDTWDDGEDDTRVEDLSPISSRRSSLQNQSQVNENDDGVDRLDGILLPDFFTYTSEERELIRRNQPIIRSQIHDTPTHRGDSELRMLRRESTPYHLPTNLFAHLSLPSKTGHHNKSGHKNSLSF